jgi:hypothetical protein
LSYILDLGCELTGRDLGKIDIFGPHVLFLLFFWFSDHHDTPCKKYLGVPTTECFYMTIYHELLTLHPSISYCLSKVSIRDHDKRVSHTLIALPRDFNRKSVRCGKHDKACLPW